MWDEENDKKISDAADNFQPAFDENAWQKMEQLLDENLPQKKGRKRLFFFLPFLFILAGLIFFVFFYHSSDNATPTQARTNTPGKSGVSKEKPVIENFPPSMNSLGSNKKANAIPGKGVRNKRATVIYENEKEANAIGKDPIQKEIDDEVISPYKTQGEVLKPDKNTGVTRPANSINSNSADKNIQPSGISKAETKPPTGIKNDLQISAETTLPKSNQHNLKQKEIKQGRFANEVSLSFSAGPGVSAVGNNEGKLTLDLGISVHYLFTKHFGVRTGVLVSKKIYSATPGQYYLPGNTYSYLQKVNANCNVVDIPLNVDYYFNQKGKHNWFVSAGLSSYLMKKESYDYVYKTPAGQTYNKEWVIENQNKHFLSILNLSAGYQYFLSKRFSLTVQPYMDLPLTGIGAGRVKLNSSGILLSVNAKPFLKKSK